MTATGVARAPTATVPDATVCPSHRAPGRPRDERVSLAITAAALHQLHSVGYGQMTMEGVAIEAGVARATVYRRYRDKADLVTAAIATTSFGDDADLDDPRRALVRFLQDFEQRFAECLEVVAALIGDSEQPCALAMHRERVVAPRAAYLRSLLAAAQQGGGLAADADLDLAVEMLAGTVLFRRLSGRSADPHWAERAVGAVWAAMGRR